MYPERWHARFPLYLLRIVVLLALSLILSGQLDGHPALSQTISSPEQIIKVRLPLVLRNLDWATPFGFEISPRNPFTGALAERGQDLGTRWVRLHRLSWREVQPEEGGGYDWSALSSFEDELRNTRQAGMIPMVLVHHSPLWATINEPAPTDCGAIRVDKLPAFAAFMQAAVERYKRTEFGVHYWEFFNEPDVDPRLVRADSVFGCWGDIDDPYYGGQHYGEMLKVVTPAIRAADPSAKVIVGGLLLARPIPNPGEGHPERFLEGILAAGAASHFDIVAYHAYPSYVGINFDYDLMPSPWQSLGGWTVGKARFLRQTMASFGVSKPLFLNETALNCNPAYYGCDPAPLDFFEAQASFLVRTFTRDRSENIQGFIWYTLDGPGWRDVGLLDSDYTPRPAYTAYQQLVNHTNWSRFEAPVDYGSDVEAYSFVRQSDRVHVAWSTDAISDTIYIPQSEFLAAYDREGNSLSPIEVGADYQFTVGFSPIYLHLRR